MNFRTTSFTFGANAIRFSAQHTADIREFQEQISSGLRVQNASDDPIAYRQITSLTSRLTELASDKTSLNTANSILNTSVVQIEEFSAIMTSAKSLAQNGIQASSASERNAFALEVDGLLTRLKTLGESEFGGSFLFGGTRSTSVPFTFSDPTVEGGTLQADYHGSQESSRAFVGEAVSVDTYYVGTDVFAAAGRSASLVLGNSGVQPGTGTDTLVGRARLSIIHESTTFSGASGLSSGTSTDSIIGASGTHTISINDTSGDGSAGTISINGGDAVAYTSTDANLEVVGPSGERVFVNTTAISAGFNGTIDVEATGSLSVDGGETKTAIDFSTNQVVKDAQGRFVTLDTAAVTQSGTDDLEFPGSSNPFQVLYELAQDLGNERGLSDADYSASITRRLEELEVIGDNAFNFLGTQSTALQTLDQLNIRIEDLEFSAESQLIELQATDIPEAVLRMENSQALLSYTYAVTAQLSNLGLLDFLR